MQYRKRKPLQFEDFIVEKLSVWREKEAVEITNGSFGVSKSC